MDRREALKKMMAGGAVVAGASMVSSSPVFAAGSVGGGQPAGDALTTPPPVAMMANGKRSATWQIAVPSMSCSSGDLRIASYAMAQTISGNLSVQVVSPTGFGVGGYVDDADTATFTAMGTGPGNSPFRRGDAFEVTWYVKYQCMVNGQPAGCQLVNYVYRYVNQANGNPDWQQAPATPFVASTSSCAL